jgi:hypothetical protein
MFSEKLWIKRLGGRFLMLLGIATLENFLMLGRNYLVVHVTKSGRFLHENYILKGKNIFLE